MSTTHTKPHGMATLLTCMTIRGALAPVAVLVVFLLQPPEASSLLDLRSSNQVSLITTYWVSNSTIPHRPEIEAAIAMNTANKHFHDVIVLLDGTNSSYNCSHFERHIYDLIQRSGVHQHARFRCEPTVAWQTTYFDIFAYSFKLPFGNIAVVANADMVFDRSIELAKRLQQGKLFTIETQGGPTHREVNMLQVYESIVQKPMKSDPPGTQPGNKRVRSRCYSDQPRYSWDAFVFHPTDILGIRPDDFMYTAYQDRERHSTLHSETARPLLMNQLGAENQALSVLQARAPDVHMYSVCEYIRMYHIHEMGKTHGANNWPMLDITMGTKLAIGAVVAYGSDTGKLLFGDVAFNNNT